MGRLFSTGRDKYIENKRSKGDKFLPIRCWSQSQRCDQLQLKVRLRLSHEPILEFLFGMQ